MLADCLEHPAYHLTVNILLWLLTQKCLMSSEMPLKKVSSAVAFKKQRPFKYLASYLQIPLPVLSLLDLGAFV